uniref:Uncharacterized protein n=1 Tax=Schistosoma mansoni TaxID=6183 RepID=A0A5K4F951_SCHMA
MIKFIGKRGIIKDISLFLNITNESLIYIPIQIILYESILNNNLITCCLNVKNINYALLNFFRYYRHGYHFEVCHSDE